MQIIYSTALFIVVCYSLMVTLMYIFQRKLMYFPSKVTPLQVDFGVADMTSIKLTTADGHENVSWYKESSISNTPTVAIFHGNAGHIGDRGYKARVFLDAGYGVLLCGYRGFGGNPGKPTETGLYEDARAALGYLSSNNCPQNQVILYGESLGTAISVQMAIEHNVKGIILEAPFTSMGAASSDHYPWLPTRFLVRDKYDSLSKITSISSPLLLIHGDQDSTVSAVQGKKLFDKVTGPKDLIWVKGAGHTDLYDYGVAEKILKWTRETFKEGTI